MNIDYIAKLATLGSAVVQGLTFLTATVALTIGYRQLRTALTNVRLSAMMHRRDLYVNLTNTLPDEHVQTMLLHICDHFKHEVYLERYHGHPERIRSYFLMKRKYLYLLLTTNFSTQNWDPARDAPNIWLAELCQYQEFRDVHASQGHYYPEFTKVVERALRKTTLTGWALSQELPAMSKATA